MMTKLIYRNLTRHPLRTTLTTLTVMAAVVVFISLLSVGKGVRRMVEETGNDTVLIVFQRYKACPPYSRLPAHYADQIAEVPGVREIMPLRFLLSTCQTTTNMMAVHGIEPGVFRRFRDIRVPDEHYAAFAGERGAALVGRAMANRYGWQRGDTVTLPELRNFSFVVRGIFDAPGSSLESVILVDRTFLEYAISDVGVVTMFLALLEDPGRIDDVSRSIDALFANYPAQTRTTAEKEFIAGTIEDFMNMVQFSQFVAYLAMVLVLAAVSNSISMNVRERWHEMALLRARGFTRRLVVRLVLVEALAGSAFAAMAGVGAALLLFAYGDFAISVEGYTITPHLSAGIMLLALLSGAGLGLLGAIIPALRGSGQPIVTALREVH